MVRKADLNQLSLLIVDPDVQLSQVCTQGLRAMGFGKVAQVRNVPEALTFLDKTPVDIVVTEAVMRPENGLSLIYAIRKSNLLSRRILSIIMLTAQAETADVKAARDAGINEFMVKPFSAKTLYTRLEQVIESPRSFVFANKFSGPDRRRREADAPEGNKRINKPRMKDKEKLRMPPIEPSALPPDYHLKLKIGLDGKLSTVITPEIVDMAQGTIDEYYVSSQSWIAEDIEGLLAAQKDAARAPSAEAKEKMEIICLRLKGRAGMFGHGIVSQVAQMFYTFLQTDYRNDHAPHHVIAQKYAETLHAAFASNMTSRDIRIGEGLIQDLRKLTQKLVNA